MSQLRIVLVFIFLTIWMLPVSFIFVDEVDAHPTLTDSDGDGYLDIFDVYDLQDVNLDLTEDYELMNDINASVTSGWNSGAGFIPLGNVGGPAFVGNFEGNSFTIDQLYINSGSDTAGLFGRVSNLGNSISNVNMTNAYTRSTNAGPAYIGILVGFGDVVIDNCDVEGQLVYNTNGDVIAGGIIGYMDWGASVTNCDADVDIDIDGGDNILIGGIVGIIFDGNGTITDCNVSGNIDLDTQSLAPSAIAAGGALGIVQGGSDASTMYIADTSADVDIELLGVDARAGGFIGAVLDPSATTQSYLVERCSALGTIDMNSVSAISGVFAAGFSTFIESGTFSQCFASGTIMNTGGAGDGYAFGWSYNVDDINTPKPPSVIDCYTRTVMLNQSNAVIGFTASVGDTNPVTIDNCFNANYYTGVPLVLVDSCIWSCNTASDTFYDSTLFSDGSLCGNVTGKTTLQMKTESTFTDAGWDFTSIWAIDPSINDEYPYLINNPPPSPGPGPPVPIVPTITTDYVTHIGSGSATAVGTLRDEGENNVTVIGFCWNTTGAPTTSDNVTSQSGSFDPFTYAIPIESLSPNTGYYLRAYATNIDGTGYGATVEFDTVPAFADDTLYLNFQPWNIFPPSSPGTIADISPYGNDASYILANMIDGITVYTTGILSGGGQFYPSQGDSDLPNKWVVPPQSGMTQQGDSSDLPLWDLFDEAATDIGVETGLLYILATFSITMGLGFLTYLIIGNILIAILLMIVFLTGFMSTGVMPLWVLVFFVAFAIGLIYVSRQT